MIEMANNSGFAMHSPGTPAWGPVVSSTPSPFSSENPDIYAKWRAWKFDQFAVFENGAPVLIKNPHALTLTERSALLRRLRATNMVVYQCANDAFSKQDLRSLALQLGLNRLDGHRYAGRDRIACIQASDDRARQRYIPYTTRAINWHTDGYYNRPERTIRAFILHCVRPAQTGGENSLLDPELVYIHLRDHNPDLLEALFDPAAMSIPANHENGELIRKRQTGPVFSVDESNGSLHVRYTARQTNITWLENSKLQEASAALKEGIDQCQSYALEHKLQQGQGVLCNNVLHRRKAFEDTADPRSKRLLYRARFYDRVIGTGITDCPAFGKRD